MSIVNQTWCPTVEVPSEIVHPACFGLSVEGDCMEPSVPNGSVAIVDPQQMPIGNGKDIAVLEIDGNYHVCRFIRIGVQVVMLHDNPRHSSLTMPAKRVKLIGKVIGSA